MSAGRIEENHIYLELFDCEIISIMGNSSDEVLEYVEDKWEFLSVEEDIQGYTVPVPSVDHTFCVLTVFVKENLSPGLIAHESYHAMKRITAFTGIQDEETGAYIMDWLVDKQHQFYTAELTPWYKKNK